MDSLFSLSWEISAPPSLLLPSLITDLGLDDGARLVHAVQVGGSAQVLARVLRVHPAEVHRHVAKVVNRRESVL